MNRYELFEEAFSSHLFLYLLFKSPDDELKTRWENTPIEQRQKLFWMPKVVENPKDYIDCGHTAFLGYDALLAGWYQFFSNGRSVVQCAGR